jgi:hypothetical protein
MSAHRALEQKRVAKSLHVSFLPITSSTSPARRQFTPSSSSKPTPPSPAPEQEKEDIEMSEEDAEDAKAKADALAAKTKGSEYYKQQQFNKTASEFKAWDLWPKDITFLVGKPPTRETPLTGVTDGTFASLTIPPHYARRRKLVYQVCKRLYVSIRSGLRSFWLEKNDGCKYERDERARQRD